MFLTQWRSSLPFAALAALALSPAALAQSEGQMTLNLGFTYDYTHVQHGDTKFTAGPLQGPVTVTNSSGGDLFPKGRSFLWSCVVFAETRSDGGLALTAPCTSTETPQDGGDMFFPVHLRSDGNLGATDQGGGGRVELRGGTGKYAGLTGRCTYEVTYLDDSFGTTAVDCTWSKP